MQKSKRQNLIYEYVKKHKDVQIADIAVAVEASPSTIRRDVKELAQKGLVVELYGSVVLESQNEVDIETNQRAKMHLEEKQAIGKIAAQHITKNQFIYVDAGTTTIEMIPYIHCEHCVFVTNGLDIALALTRRGYEVQILGGFIKPVTEAIVGEFALEYLAQLHFDLAFIGANGVSELGFSTPDHKEGLLKKRVIQNARQSYILADTSKENKTTSFIFGKKEEAIWIHEKGEVL